MMIFSKNQKIKKGLDELFNSADHKKDVKSINPAFTLAEVLLVLVILGVIAAITMPTLNLSGNKEKALKVKAEKVVGDLDKTFDLIKFNDSNGSLLTMYDPYTPGATISISNPDDSDKFKALLAKYLKITNKPCNDLSTCPCAGREDGYNLTSSVAFYLNNGACVGILMHYRRQAGFGFPEPNCDSRIQHDAVMYLDINGSDGPNSKGLDQYIIPITQNGIDYSCTLCTVTSCVECVPGDRLKCVRCKTMCLNEGTGEYEHCTYKVSNDGSECVLQEEE